MDRNNNYLSTYRETTIGASLEDALDDLLDQTDITDATPQLIREHFDREMFVNFKNLPKVRPAKISGFCHYQNVEDIWKFEIKDLEIKDEHFKKDSDLCKLVAVSAKNNPIEEAPKEVQKRARRSCSPSTLTDPDTSAPF